MAVSTKSIKFNGTNQGAKITDAAQTGLDFSTTFTWEAWIKPDSLSGITPLCTKSDDSGYSTRSYDVYLADASNFWTWAGDGTQLDLYQAGTVPTVDTWEHWAVTVDVSEPAATTFEWFKNGVSIGHGVQQQANNITSILNSGEDFTIGYRLGDSDHYGDIQFYEYRVWSDIRTEAEILANYQTTVAADSAGLVSYFKFQDDLTDEHSNGNDLTAVGTPTYSTDVPTIWEFPDTWTGYQEITTDEDKVSGSSDLTDFPVLIKDGNLSDTVYAGLETDGSDLRITTDEAGTTEIPFEIVSIDTTAKTCEIWAKVPTLTYATSTSLFVWYGEALASAYGVDDTYGAKAVWSNGYQVVIHGDSLFDSVNGRSMTNHSVTADVSGGQIGGSLEFVDRGNPNYNDWIDLGSGTVNVTDEMSQEFWVNFHDSSNARFFVKHGGGSYGFSFWRTTYDTGNTFGGGISINGTDWNDFYGTADIAPINTLLYGVLNYDGANVRIYVDGVEDTGGTLPLALTGSINAAPANLWLSEYITNGTGMDGLYDEARLSNVSRTADWYATQYNNQDDPSTFWVSDATRRVFNIT